MGRLNVTYQDYIELYGGSIIPEAAWLRSYNDAEALVSAMTFGRIRGNLLDSERELAVLAVCAAAEGLFRSDMGKSIASENNDGYSVSYRSPKEIQNDAMKAAETFLSDTGLLYKGVCG